MSRRREPAMKVVDSAVLKKGFHEVQEYPSRRLRVEPVLLVHRLVVYDHVSIPVPTVHHIVPAVLALVCSYPLAERCDILQPTVWPFGPLEDQARDSVDIDAVLELVGEECMGRAGIY